MVDHDPRSEDLDDLAGDTAWCPHCGVELWDQAQVCSECGQALVDGPSSHPPSRIMQRKGLIAVVILLLLLGMYFLIRQGAW